MRQSDGSEILGPDDPRTMVIGIIHVAPNDDRQSVLTAISTQEKLGRDQIVLDLPAQNKAFKSAVDFEGLRKITSEIEATLVLVAPERSKLATYAKKERFLFYPSLDELAAAEFPPLQPEDEEQPASAPVEDDPSDHAITFPVPTPTKSTSASPATPKPATHPANTAKVQAAVQDQQPLPVMPETPLPDQQNEADTAPLLEMDEPPTDPGLKAVSAQAVPQNADETSAQSQPAPLAPGAGALVPSGAQPPAFFYEPPSISSYPPRRSWRGLLITGLIVLLLIGIGILFNRPILDLFFPPTATVTIIPASQHLQHTYQITAVLGVPDPSKNQVDARAIYANSQPQSSTVKATGQGQIPGQQAQGELTFYNVTTTQQMVPAGTVIFDSHNSNIAVVNEHTITLPAFDPTTGLHGLPDSAHTIGMGSNQNIPAGELNRTLCCGGVYVNNIDAFSGGQDPRTFAYVQQSDIDSAAQGLEATLAPQSTQILQGQTRQNERPAGPPRCAPQVKSDALAGDQAGMVTVTVTMSCLGEVYDMQAVQALAAHKLVQDASVNPGPAYAPVGEMLAQVAQTTPDGHGDILLTVNTSGVWAYQFSNVQRAALRHLIAGKSSQDARAILLRQPGVHDVTITLTGVGATIIPNDLAHITINVEAVQGLHI